jgi:hypothetical protein
MKKLILFLALIVSVVHAENLLYLDASGKGIGIGDKFKFNVCFIHFGGHIFLDYKYNEPILSPNWHFPPFLRSCPFSRSN